MDRIAITAKPIVRIFEHILSEATPTDTISNLLPNIQSGWSQAITENNWDTREITIWATGIVTTVGLIVLGIYLYRRTSLQAAARQEVLGLVAIGPIIDQHERVNLQKQWKENDGANQPEDNNVEAYFATCNSIATASTDFQDPNNFFVALQQLQARYSDRGIQKAIIAPLYQQYFDAYSFDTLDLQASLFEKLAALLTLYNSYSTLLTEQETQDLNDFAYRALQQYCTLERPKDNIKTFMECSGDHYITFMAVTAQRYSASTLATWTFDAERDFQKILNDLSMYLTLSKWDSEGRAKVEIDDILPVILQDDLTRECSSATSEVIQALRALGNFVLLIFKQTNLNGEELEDRAIIHVRWKGGEQEIREQIKSLIVRNSETDASRIRLHRLSIEGVGHGTRSLSTLSIDPLKREGWLRANQHNLWYSIAPETSSTESSGEDSSINDVRPTATTRDEHHDIDPYGLL